MEALFLNAPPEPRADLGPGTYRVDVLLTVSSEFNPGPASSEMQNANPTVAIDARRAKLIQIENQFLSVSQTSSWLQLLGFSFVQTHREVTCRSNEKANGSIFVP